MKKVLTAGVFDYYHLGHLRLLKNAKKLGDHLIVAVQEEDCIKKTKPDADIMYSIEERIEMIEALRPVDEVITYRDVDALVPCVDFDVFAVGEDQTHDGFLRAEKWCLDHGKEVVRLKRTPRISSSEIKKNILV